MKIERIDDKTVKCFLSNEELEQYDIDYKDFVTRSEKAREMVQEIMEQAAEEVGYKPPQFAFDLQIMMMPEQGMILTFSEKEPIDMKNADQIMECLRDVKQMLQKKREEMEANSGKPNDVAVVEEKRPARTEKVSVTRPEDAVFVFDRLASVMEFADILPANLRVRSTLYVMNSEYYLYIQKGGAAYERYGRACIQAMEFGYLYTAERDQILHLKEHGECLIAEQALKKLRMNSGKQSADNSRITGKQQHHKEKFAGHECNR